MNTTTHIVTMGGGGFSMEPNNPLLDDYVLGLTGKARPRVCFVPTASGDAAQYTERFYRAFNTDRCAASHLPLFGRDATDPRDHLLKADVIYVGGGNTANMLAVWRVHGVDTVMREVWQRGVVLAGVSAGAICWFACSVTDSFGPLAALRDGLAMLAGSCCPHYDGEADRRPTYHRLIAEGFPLGIALDDGAAAHYIDGELSRVVTSRPTAGAYRVEPIDGEVRERELPVEYLGANDG